MVLFFDDSTMSVGDQARARQTALKFIQGNAGANRYISIVDFGGSVRVRQNFTADAERLKQAVRDVKYSSVSSNVDTVQTASLGSAQMMRAQADFGARTLLLGIRSIARNLAAVPGRKSLVLLTSGFPLTPDRESELTAVINVCNKANVAVYPIDVSGLTAGVDASTGGGSARRQMPAGIDIPRLVNASLNYFPSPEGEGQAGKGGQSGGGSGGKGGAGGTGGKGGAGGAGGKGGVGGATGGTGGGKSPGSGGGGMYGNTGGYAGSPRHSPYTQPYNRPRQIVPIIPQTTVSKQQVLYSLAEGTGGFVLVNSNDLLAGLEKITKEENEYYVLGYAPPASDEGRLPYPAGQSRPGRNYSPVAQRLLQCEIGRSAGRKARREAVGDARYRGSGRKRRGFHAGSVLLLLAEYRARGPGHRDSGRRRQLYQAEGKVSRHGGRARPGLQARRIGGRALQRHVPLDFEDKKEVEAFSKQPLHYGHQFEAAPGQYNLKVVYASGGTNFGKLEIPLVIDAYDGKQIAMSGIAFSKEVLPVSQAAESLSAELLEDQVPLVSQGFQFVPSGNDRFKKNQPGAFYIEIYDPLLAGPKPSQVTLQVRVVDRKTGAPKVDASGAVPDDKDGNSVVPLGLKIPLETLPPGSYRLELKATDYAGNATAPRSTDFEVE